MYLKLPFWNDKGEIEVLCIVCCVVMEGEYARMYGEYESSHLIKDLWDNLTPIDE